MYKINPVKATCAKYKDKCDLPSINDTCYGICAAFGKSNNVWEMNEECAASCKEFIEQKKIDLYGVGSCDHQAPYRPVIWDQTPRFFPRLLDRYDPETALQLCAKSCENTNLPNQCKDYCALDYSAVESYGKKDIPISQNIPVKESIPEMKDKDPVGFIVVIALLIAGIIIVSTTILKGKKL